MATKRTLQQDPEYDDIPSDVQEKRIKLLEDSVRKQTEKKIEAIIKSSFEPEIAKKREEIDSIDEVLHEARCMLDRLRACAITKYYATLVQGQVPNEQSSTSIHPTVKKYLGKTPRQHMECGTINRLESSHQNANQSNDDSAKSHEFPQFNSQIKLNQVPETVTKYGQSPSKGAEEISTRAPRFKTKCKIVVGNISKFIPVWHRDGSDQSTHKWMVYVRGDKDHTNIESFVKKVRFLLHPSYRPSDIVEISNPPFHLIKRGWGEFPVRVQLHFHDPRNKPVDIIHNLKLDKTFTSLQTMGGETVAELQLFKPDDPKVTSTNGPFSFASTSQSDHASSSSNITTVSCNGSNSSDSSLIQEKDNVHTIIKKEPDSLVMNIKLPKTITGVQTPTVNNHKITLSSSDSTKSATSSEANSEKRTVPKIVISNNRVTTKGSATKPFTLINGINTTVVRCTNSEGKVLLVPPSSLTFKAPPNLIKQETLQSNSSTDGQNVTKTVPSYYVKVVPNQESGQKQILLIPFPGKKAKNSTVKPLSETKKEQTVETDTKEKTGNASSVASMFRTNPRLLYQFELDNIKLEYCKNFEDLLKRVCKIFPLVKPNVDRTILTFCARSLKEFHTWNIGKQKACEYRRAGKVRKEILKLLIRKNCTHITPDMVWRQSTIMSWCRKNGFVPMARETVLKEHLHLKEHVSCQISSIIIRGRPPLMTTVVSVESTEKVTLLPEPKWSGVELCTLTSPDNLISSLPEEKYTPVISDDDEEIDIVSVVDNKSKKASATVEEDACYMPHLSESAQFIKHSVSQLGIDIKPVELEPKLYFPAIEEMLLSAVKQFASDLIGASLNEGFNRLGGKICPEEITVSDLYSAVKNNSKFDFVSNNHLGLPKEPKGNT